MPSTRNLVTSVQRWTFLVPLGTAYLIGVVTWQSWEFFLVMSILALGPAVFGCADPVGEVVDYIGRERRRREQARARRETVAQHAVGFFPPPAGTRRRGASGHGAMPYSWPERL